jgi:hypothetical protein
LIANPPHTCAEAVDRLISDPAPERFQKVAETRLGPDVYGALLAETAQRLAQMDRETEVESDDGSGSEGEERRQACRMSVTATFFSHARSRKTQL